MKVAILGGSVSHRMEDIKELYMLFLKFTV